MNAHAWYSCSLLPSRIVHHSSPSFGMTWPIDENGEFYSRIQWEGLLPRERDVVAFLDVQFHPQAKIEFLDVNMKLSRILSGHCEDYVLKRLTGHTPWHPSVPTIVGSNKIVCRYSPPDGQQTDVTRTRLRCSQLWHTTCL